jgi:uncharacterized glyoxalase superfamily protein PhnB
MILGNLQVTLFVQDVMRSVEFYRNALGFRFKGYWDAETQRAVEIWEKEARPGYAELRVGDSSIGLRSAKGEIVPGSIECAVEVGDLNSLYSKLLQMSIRVSQPEDQPWGTRTMTVLDPDGHPWIILESAAEG